MLLVNILLLFGIFYIILGFFLNMCVMWAKLSTQSLYLALQVCKFPNFKKKSYINECKCSIGTFLFAWCKKCVIQQRVLKIYYFEDLAQCLQMCIWALWNFTNYISELLSLKEQLLHFTLFYNVCAQIKRLKKQYSDNVRYEQSHRICSFHSGQDEGKCPGEACWSGCDMFKITPEFQCFPKAGQLCTVPVSSDCLKAHFKKIIYKRNEKANVIIHSHFVWSVLCYPLLTLIEIGNSLHMFIPWLQQNKNSCITRLNPASTK